MMYAPNKIRAKEPQNPQNHRVGWIFTVPSNNIILTINSMSYYLFFFGLSNGPQKKIHGEESFFCGSSTRPQVSSPIPAELG